MFRTQIAVYCLLIFLISCNTKAKKIDKNVKVRITQIGNQFQLQVNGKPFLVKGAGIDYSCGSNFKALKEAGGTVVRTWNTDFAEEILDSVATYGLMVVTIGYLSMFMMEKEK